jgi:hypothetical protein
VSVLLTLSLSWIVFLPFKLRTLIFSSGPTLWYFFHIERLWSSRMTLDICSFIIASHRVRNRGMEGKERVNISYGLLKRRLLCDILSLRCWGRFVSPRLVCVVDWRRVADGPDVRVAFIFNVKQYEKYFYRNVLPGISLYNSHGIVTCSLTSQGFFETSSGLPA